MSVRRDLVARDAACLWHPYTQHATEPAPLAVHAARGACLELEDGTQIIDAISSWWTCLHGHGRPELVEAMARQAARLDHVLFAGATHAPAVQLAEELLALAPGGLTRVFYSDDGSTAVEVALKLAHQSWRQRGEPQRRIFIALEGAYHGDTFGAMSVGDPVPFFQSWSPFLFEVRRVAPDAAELALVLQELGREACALIVEPLVQGAGGMRMHSAAFLRDARALCSAHGVPLIADEVMTGFGRTGEFFACHKAGIKPDLLCLSKGLTGGILPLAATLVTEALYRDFLAPDRARAFFHGHSFTANPIACATALASLEICRREQTPVLLDTLGAAIERQLRAKLQGRSLESLRRCGGIVAFALPLPAGADGGYLAEMAPRLRAEARALGVLLRPLGDVLYALPPSCTSTAQAARIAEVMLVLERSAALSA